MRHTTATVNPTQRSPLRRSAIMACLREHEWKSVTRIAAEVEDSIPPECAVRLSYCYSRGTLLLPHCTIDERRIRGYRRLVNKLLSQIYRDGCAEKMMSGKERLWRLTKKGVDRRAKQEAQARSSAD